MLEKAHVGVRWLQLRLVQGQNTVGDLGDAEHLIEGEIDILVLEGRVMHVVCGELFVVQGVGLTDASNILKEINLYSYFQIYLTTWCETEVQIRAMIR